jgi:Domain of unknown function DUF29
MAEYDRDFYAWTLAQAEALRAKNWQALDREHLAEEIEALGKSDRRALQSHLRILLLHLFKVAYQRQRRLSWLRSIRNSREAIELVLGDSPSLRHEVPDCLAWAYPKARQAAAEETRLPLATFPDRCPWNLDQLQDDDFLLERPA